MKKLLHALDEERGGLRRRAERLLRQQPARVVRLESRADTQRLLQELQIHHIELELQNEELKHAKAEVDVGLEKYTDLYDFAPVGYFSLDEQGQVLEANLTGCAMLGLERSKVNQRRFQLFVTPQCRALFNDFLERIFARHQKQVCEVALLNARGATFWADLQALSASTGSDGRKWCRMAIIDVAARKQAEAAQHRIDLLFASNRDLLQEIRRRRIVETALKKSEQHAHQLLAQSRLLQKKLRQMSHQILLVQENQRKEISRELHDKISQLLIGINVQLAVFARTAEIDPEGIRRTLAPVCRLVAKSVRVVHQFARELRPAVLDDLGLIPALRSYIANLPRRKNRKIEFAAFVGVEAMDIDKRTVLYRVAQEALTNVTRHAGASVVNVSIFKARGGVCLEIADNGKAFDVARLSSPRWSQRLGLTGMRERVEMVGGRFGIVSEPGTGTIVRAEIPFGNIKLAG